MSVSEPCPVCGVECHVSVKGTLRRHPKGAEDPCAGSGYVVRAPDAPTAPAAPSQPLTTPSPSREADEPITPAVVRPGVYRSTEPMLDPRAPVPPGHMIVRMTAVVPYDGSNGRDPQAEAALLYEDPAYLYRVLDETPNERMSLAIKVD